MMIKTRSSRIDELTEFVKSESVCLNQHLNLIESNTSRKSSLWCVWGHHNLDRRRKQGISGLDRESCPTTEVSINCECDFWPIECVFYNIKSDPNKPGTFVTTHFSSALPPSNKAMGILCHSLLPPDAEQEFFFLLSACLLWIQLNIIYIQGL